MRKEPYRGISKIPKENTDLQSEWPEAYQVSFSVSTWQQGDNFQNNKSTVGNVKVILICNLRSIKTGLKRHGVISNLPVQELSRGVPLNT